MDRLSPSEAGTCVGASLDRSELRMCARGVDGSGSRGTAARERVAGRVGVSGTAGGAGSVPCCAPACRLAGWCGRGLLRMLAFACSCAAGSTARNIFEFEPGPAVAMSVAGARLRVTGPGARAALWVPRLEAVALLVSMPLFN